ncbi:hypothetical protein GALMADRAFT_489789 [Galerina marginata CBS 339.88]|uniref:Reverse transcriptase zinc-binding domain-containing protein n=1 Tax=Galerina marginata (strain CBS 339.88) TaxID=685588 RepID=A0A067T9B8_GALM3|nr:hypothetical protein GALMADRAFT_489789 [Galerina marginata CBS 339.88]
MVDQFKYVGITFTSTHRCIFAQHYLNKASTARSVMYSTLAMESFVGSLPVHEGLQLYMARVDPHLVSGCEVSVDVDDSLLAVLEAVQLHFLRRILGLHDRSMRAVLFTETGVMPLKYRRIILALRYIIYLLSLPHTHYARAAFDDSIDLWSRQQSSWVGDLQVVLHRLPVPVNFVCHHVGNPATIVELVELVKRSCLQTLYDDVFSSDRAYLLWGSRPPLHASLRMSGYLRAVVVDAHRKALTQLLCSGHSLAVEVLRYRSRYRLVVPRQYRLCRFCHGQIEDEVHALFHCPGSLPLQDARKDFFMALRSISPKWLVCFMESDPVDFIHIILREEPLTIPFAKLAFRVLEHYGTVDLYVLPQFVVRM